jgi:hypothetical protein
MVDKISSAGQNVFLNPAYHPTNQAIPPAAGSLPEPLPDRAIRGGGNPVGYRLGQSKTGTGLRMGEAINEPGDNYNGGSGRVPTVSDERTSHFSTPKPRVFNPIYPEPVGTKQVIEAPNGGPKTKPGTIQLKVGDTSPTPTGAPPADTQQAPPPETDQPDQPPAQDPPESH